MSQEGRIDGSMRSTKGSTLTVPRLYEENLSIWGVLADGTLTLASSHHAAVDRYRQTVNPCFPPPRTGRQIQTEH